MRYFTDDAEPVAAKSRRRHVVLIIETSNEYGRGLLRGIKGYLRKHGPWSIYLAEQSRYNTDLSWLSNWEGDGIIARIENEDIAQFILDCGLPTVNVSASRLVPRLPCVETDDKFIARMAADHLLERGFKSFGFCGDSQFGWSRLRAQYFSSYIEQAGYPCLIYDSVDDHLQSSRYTKRQELSQWLLSLPKPAGIMACYDIQGQQILEACRLAKIAVPDEAAVIGVDNDELLCELSDPPLSSVIPDTLTTGFQAASMLDGLMNGATYPNETQLIEPCGIKTRLSSDVLATDDRMVSDAVRYIRNHAHLDIDVSDVLAHIPLSRRVLDSRFKKELGRTPHDEIMETKIKLVKQLLSETDLSLALIAERAGFKHAEYVSVFFKKMTGITPGIYRNRNQR